MTRSSSEAAVGASVPNGSPVQRQASAGHGGNPPANAAVGSATAFRALLDSLADARTDAHGMATGGHRTKSRDGRDERSAEELATAGVDHARFASAGFVSSAEPRSPASPAGRLELEALFERAVTSMQLGRVGRDDPIARLRVAVGRGEVDVELVHEESGIRATLRSEDDRLATAFASKVQREFDACGLTGITIDVEI